ncbi:hypothetical protein STIUS_v1c03100 [Spiroplasma sp. TIUS-1]|uniref:hypothetical protein n=1 Tax=Spiroplasma sp. TIUS-1 TaxID=216963 RepID=UPI001396E61B|nr:hypothetical protein [Spiroplasma sp. TIUS-1]QHX35864.1 hypothetical protein STIUS_v1c03100 [Spiroplasma sp. TIUS-1]
MKNIVDSSCIMKFDSKIFNMSVVELEIIELFEECVAQNQIDSLWNRLYKLFNDNEKIRLIIELFKKGAISMIECESLILLFARHNQKIWNNFGEKFKYSTEFRAPFEMINNILNIDYDSYKLSISELKFLSKIMRLGDQVTYMDFYRKEMSSFKNLLVVKTFFMKRSILEDYSKTDYYENINDLKIKTVKDLICEFLQRKIISKN